MHGINFSSASPVLGYSETEKYLMLTLITKGCGRGHAQNPDVGKKPKKTKTYENIILEP